MKNFILMIQFLTQIPININLDVDIENFHKGISYFALVGAIIGGVLYGTAYMLHDVFSTLLLACIILIVEILLTGGLHLDGLADSADGMFSNRPKERILEIMKDSRVGSNGALALIIYFVFKLLLINEVLEKDYVFLIFIMPVVSRGLMAYIFKTAKYAREEGMGNFFIGKAKLNQIIMNLLIIALAVGTHIGLWLSISAVFLINIVIRRSFTKKIDGLTGDSIGFLIEVDEILFIVFSLWVLSGVW